MLLPNADKAVVEISKLRDYCLNPNHEIGKHKARVFAATLNLGIWDVEILKAALIDAVKTNDAVSETLNNYGQRYRLISNLIILAK